MKWSGHSYFPHLVSFSGSPSRFVLILFLARSDSSPDSILVYISFSFTLPLQSVFSRYVLRMPMYIGDAAVTGSAVTDSAVPRSAVSHSGVIRSGSAAIDHAAIPSGEDN